MPFQVAFHSVESVLHGDDLGRACRDIVRDNDVLLHILESEILIIRGHDGNQHGS